MAKGFRISPAEETDLDFSHLEKLRKRLENTDMAALTLLYSLPDKYSGSHPDDAGRCAESFLRKCMTAVKKDIDDILRSDTREDL
jgi:hypothetical protein